MISFDDLVSGIFAREGDVYSEPPQNDQPTGPGGIVLATLEDYVRVTKAPLAPTVETLKTLTHDQAVAIVTWKLQTLLRTSGLNHIAFEPMRVFYLDFAYNSGPERAIRWLQRVLDVPVTGLMDIPTISAVTYPSIKQIQSFVHQASIAARAQMISGAVDCHTIAKDEEYGLIRRAVAFSLLRVS